MALILLIGSDLHVYRGHAGVSKVWVVRENPQLMFKIKIDQRLGTPVAMNSLAKSLPSGIIMEHIP